MASATYPRREGVGAEERKPPRAATARYCPPDPGRLRGLRSHHKAACATTRPADHPAVGLQRARHGGACELSGGACRRGEQPLAGGGTRRAYRPYLDRSGGAAGDHIVLPCVGALGHGGGPLQSALERRL